MGVLTMEIEKVNKTIIENQKEVEKKAKQLEHSKEKEKERKIYEKDLTKAVENDCISVMKRCFEKEGYHNACINLSLASTREDILKHVPESDFERQYLDDNYERLFNKVKKIYANDEKAKEQLQQIIIEKQLEQQQIQQEEVQKNPIFKLIIFLVFIAILLFIVIKWGFIILCGVGFIFFMMILFSAKGK